MKRCSLLMPIATAAMAITGCATSFTGDAHFPGGPGGCAKKCESDGLVMESFVYAGEYSSACVCSPKKATASAGEAGAVPPAAGVMMQMQRQQQQQRAAR